MVHINKDKCIGCGKCCDDCVSAALQLKDEKADMIADYCLLCGHCVAVCPMNAVTIDEYDMEEVIEYNQETFGVDENTMLNTIMFRRSIRSFKEGQVEKEKIEKILEAGRYSPTGSNAQNVSYIVVQDDILKYREEGNKAFKRLIQISGNMKKALLQLENDDYLFKGAPTLILVISESEVNASIASANMELVANSQGLGMLYVGYFVYLVNHDKKLKQILELTDNQKIVTCLAVGFPNVQYKRTAPRKKVQVQWR